MLLQPLRAEGWQLCLPSPRKFELHFGRLANSSWRRLPRRLKDYTIITPRPSDAVPWNGDLTPISGGNLDMLGCLSPSQFLSTIVRNLRRNLEKTDKMFCCSRCHTHHLLNKQGEHSKRRCCQVRQLTIFKDWRRSEILISCMMMWVSYSTPRRSHSYDSVLHSLIPNVSFLVHCLLKKTSAFLLIFSLKKCR